MGSEYAHSEYAQPRGSHLIAPIVIGGVLDFFFFWGGGGVCLCRILSAERCINTSCAKRPESFHGIGLYRISTVFLFFLSSFFVHSVSATTRKEGLPRAPSSFVSCWPSALASFVTSFHRSFQSWLSWLLGILLLLVWLRLVTFVSPLTSLGAPLSFASMHTLCT